MKLSLAEGLYLIVLDDEEGRLLSAAERTYVPGLLSAAILELYLMGKVSLEDSTIKVVDTSGTGNGILDKILNQLNSETKFTDELNELTPHFGDIRMDMDQLLVQRGILRREETKLLWIPLSERMDNANYAFEQEIRNVLQAMVFQNAKVTPSFVILLSLIYDCKILDEVFHDKDDLIDAVKVAKDIVNKDDLDPEIAKVLHDLRSYFAGL